MKTSFNFISQSFIANGTYGGTVIRYAMNSLALTMLEATDS